MKDIIKYIANELDYRKEFSTKEFIIYTILATACMVLACCGESLINMM